MTFLGIVSPSTPEVTVLFQSTEMGANQPGGSQETLLFRNMP